MVICYISYMTSWDETVLVSQADVKENNVVNYFWVNPYTVTGNRIIK